MFGIVAMLGSVVLLIQTLRQTLAQMTTNNPRMGAQQALQVVVCTKTHTHTHRIVRITVGHALLNQVRGQQAFRFK